MATSAKISKPTLVKSLDQVTQKLPSLPKPPPVPVVVEDDDGEEALNVEANVTAQDEHEYGGKSATQVEDDVKELFKGTVVNHEVEIKEGSDIVEKFAEGFRLLRHQIQAREWMKQRETGSSRGGILADDMGLVTFSPLLLLLFWGLNCSQARENDPNPRPHRGGETSQERQN